MWRVLIGEDFWGKLGMLMCLKIVDFLWMQIN